jgi:hypothetical protein
MVLYTRTTSSPSFALLEGSADGVTVPVGAGEAVLDVPCAEAVRGSCGVEVRDGGMAGMSVFNTRVALLRGLGAACQ